MLTKSMFDIPWVLEILLKRKWTVVLLTGLLYSGLAFAYFKVTPRYPSISKWISLPESSVLPNLQGFGSLLGGSFSSSSDNFANYNDIIMSTEFLSPLLDRKIYVNATGDSALLKDVLNKKEFLNKKTPKSTMDIRRKKMAQIEMLRGCIDFISRSSVYQLRIQAWDPGLAQSLSQRIIERAKEYNSNERLGKSKRKRRFLGEQLDSFKLALKKSEDTLVAFQLQNREIQNPALLVQRERLAREIEINSQLVLEFRKQYELTRADEDNEAVEISVIEKPTFSFQKSFPTTKLFFGAGFLASLIFSLGVILFFEFIRSQIKENTGT